MTIAHLVFRRDRVMEAPERWVFPFHNDEIATFKLDEKEVQGLVLGRRTYEILAESWPTRTGPLADRMNRIPKYVATRIPANLTWHNSHPMNDPVNAVTALKRELDPPLLITGSGKLVHTLMKADLVDELRLLVFPILRGRGKRPFDDGISADLELGETRAFDTGVTLLRYGTEHKQAPEHGISGRTVFGSSGSALVNTRWEPIRTTVGL